MNAPSIDRGRLRALLEETVAVYSPPGGEAEVTGVYEAALRAADLRVDRQPVPRDGAPDRANLVAGLGPAPAGLLLLGHVDTVPLAEGEAHAPTWDGDVLRGLGAADMKGGCAAMIEALRAVRETGTVLRRGVELALVVGEEEDGDGAWALFKRSTPPLVVIGEPTGLSPCVSHYGYLEIELEVAGRRAHAALPEHGASAIDGMIVWLGQIREALRRREAVLSIRRIEGGGDLFAVSERCRALLDVHLPPGADPAHIESAVETAGASVEGVGLRAIANREFWAPGDHTPADAERLSPLSRALSACGLPGEPASFRSHSDANLLHGHDATAVVLGPGRLEVAHTRAEEISLDEVERAAALYARLILEACG